MHLIRTGHKGENPLERRVYILFDSGKEINFLYSNCKHHHNELRYHCQDEKIHKVTIPVEMIPAEYEKDGLKIKRRVPAWRFGEGCSNESIEEIVEKEIKEKTAKENTFGLPDQAKLNYLPPFDKDKWERKPVKRKYEDFRKGLKYTDPGKKED